MAAITNVLLETVALSPAWQVLELGCGAGAQIRAISGRLDPAKIVGSDLHPLALAAARAVVAPSLSLCQSNLLHLPFAEASFDLVLALDAFDQVGVEIGQALSEARRVLRRGGLLLLRVSAWSVLFSAHDRAFNTGRRYDPSELRDLIESAGYTVERVTLANCLLGAPVVLLRVWGTLTGSTGGEGVYRSRVANALVQKSLEMEARWLRSHNLTVGLSVMAVARRTEQDRGMSHTAVLAAD
jgi:SAM-dependent methyltransferase